MIRSVTLITAGLAVASGLYLYHAKNVVLMLDRKIERIARDTIAVSEQTRLLHAEWTLLNDPERLRQFSDRYLALKPLTPGQFTSLTDLPARLPAPRPPEAETPPPVTIETAAPPQADPVEDPSVAIATDDALPLPPIPVPPPASRPTSAPPIQVAAPSPVRVPETTQSAVVQGRPPLQVSAPLPAPRPVDPKPAEARLAEARGADPRAGETRLAAARLPPQNAPATTPAAGAVPPPASRPAVPTPVASAPPTNAPPPVRAAYVPPAATYAPAARQQPAAYYAPQPSGGSMLGGAARGATVPLPRPTPYSAPIQDGGG